MKIERWAGTGFSWDFDQGRAQPKGPGGEIPGSPLPERTQGCPLGQSRVSGQPRGDGNQMRRVLRFWFGLGRDLRERKRSDSFRGEEFGLRWWSVRSLISNGKML